MVGCEAPRSRSLVGTWVIKNGEQSFRLRLGESLATTLHRAAEAAVLVEGRRALGQADFSIEVVGFHLAVFEAGKGLQFAGNGRCRETEEGEDREEGAHIESEAGKAS